MVEQTTRKAFFAWLRKRSGQKVKIEDFRAHHKRNDIDWQKANTALTSMARNAGLIKSCGVTRDKYRGYKTRWLVL